MTDVYRRYLTIIVLVISEKCPFLSLHSINEISYPVLSTKPELSSLTCKDIPPFLPNIKCLFGLLATYCVFCKTWINELEIETIYYAIDAIYEFRTR